MDDITFDRPTIDDGPDGEIEMPIIVRKRTPLYIYLGDFFNTVKAFIGTNYQALPFAFAQSGLIFGLIGVLVIATLTDHCICLLIKCKYIVINNIIHQHSSEIPTSADELHSRRQMLERGMGYGDIGKIALGRWGKVVIDIAVWFTQLMTCVCYFIFIGNAVVSIYPLEPALIPLNNSNTSTAKPPVQQPLGMDNLIFPESHQTHLHSSQLLDSHLIYMADKALSMRTTGKSKAKLTGLLLVEYNITNSPSVTPTTRISGTGYGNMTSRLSKTSPYGIKTTTATMPPTPAQVEVSTAPSLKLLVMIPLPLFILTSLIRNLRLLSPFSVIATIALFAGAIAVLVFMIIDFSICKDGFQLTRWATLPLFIGQITGAYEGIGCIVPIEGSMEGNRRVFPAFLHSAVYIVFTILCSFGVIGYLRYGHGVQQLIILSIKQHTLYAMLIDVTLIISVACTYPLQFYPCIQIVESYLFSRDAIFGPKDTKKSSGLVTERDPLILEQEEVHKEESLHASSVIPSSVSAWKRNVVRILHVMVTLGFAVLLRNNYAYMSSITGAVGASVLAFIIPCLVHLKLRWHEMSWIVKFKDFAIIFTSITCSIATLVVFSIKLARHEISQ